MNYARILGLPKKSFFLFGPRGTGKTTWLQQVLPNAFWFNLLNTSELLQLMRDPSLFEKRIVAGSRKGWVVVDEIQRYPTLLNEVQRIMTDHPNRFLFALTGSSARKLKKGEANLLAGRAVNRKFFPLTAAEMKFDVNIENILRFGLLPGSRILEDETDQIDFLDAYCSNYIREEIQQEALVKNLDSFSRFLEVAALSNAQVTNVSSISRDAGVSRSTVDGYFEILVDTLVGTWLPAWRPRAKIKEKSLPKFYFFDPGVVRGVAGRLREPVDGLERGFLLETLLFHELKAYTHYFGLGGELFYWKTPSGSEVDFVWTRGARSIGIEAKANKRWKPEFGKALKELHSGKKIKECYGVYFGSEELQDGPISVFPYVNFLKALYDGKII